MSRKYESSGDPGAIANNSGDIGGASYGTYQIATKTGTMGSFIDYVKNNSKEVYNALQGKMPGTFSFNQAWASLAKRNAAAFEKVQHDFIANSHFQPSLDSIKKNTGFDASKSSRTVQDVLWSTAVQHGVQGATSVFKNAGITANMSDKEIIQRVYNERSANNGNKYFGKSSDAVRKSVLNRYKSELRDALAMLEV